MVWSRCFCRTGLRIMFVCQDDGKFEMGGMPDLFEGEVISSCNVRIKEKHC